MNTKVMNAAIKEYCEKLCEEDICPEDGSCVIEKECEECMGRFERHPDLCEVAYEKVIECTKSQETPEEEPTVDMVNHPSHYTQGGMECIDEMILIFGKQAVANFCVCNAWKYRKRAMFKNGQEDIDKSDWYINKFKELQDEE